MKTCIWLFRRMVLGYAVDRPVMCVDKPYSTLLTLPSFLLSFSFAHSFILPFFLSSLHSSFHPFHSAHSTRSLTHSLTDTTQNSNDNATPPSPSPQPPTFTVRPSLLYIPQRQRPHPPLRHAPQHCPRNQIFHRTIHGLRRRSLL